MAYSEQSSRGWNFRVTFDMHCPCRAVRRTENKEKVIYVSISDLYSLALIHTKRKGIDKEVKPMELSIGGGRHNVTKYKNALKIYEGFKDKVVSLKEILNHRCSLKNIKVSPEKLYEDLMKLPDITPGRFPEKEPHIPRVKQTEKKRKATENATVIDITNNKAAKIQKDIIDLSQFSLVKLKELKENMKECPEIKKTISDIIIDREEKIEEVYFCSYDGISRIPGDKYCKKCGKEYERSGFTCRVCPKCHRVNHEDRIICKGCAAYLIR
jgi:hypothetical protein